MLRNNKQQQTDHTKAVQLERPAAHTALPGCLSLRAHDCLLVSSPIHADIQQGSNEAGDLPAALPLSQAEPLERRTQIRLGALAVQVQ